MGGRANINRTMSTASIAAPVRLAADDAAVNGLQQAVGVLSSKWSVAVLARLCGGTQRFHELLDTIDGVSRRMLSATLRKLERDGLIERRVYARVPARVEYELSDAGSALVGALGPLLDWEAQHRQAVARARAQFDQLQRFRAERDALQAASQARSPRIV
jgi:DNA-binding HxlR family transcriptional regulator